MGTVGQGFGNGHLLSVKVGVFDIFHALSPSVVSKRLPNGDPFAPFCDLTGVG